MIQYVNDIQYDVLMETARRMCAAAVTAPKASGQDKVVTAIVTGETRDRIIEKMREIGEEYDEDFIRRDDWQTVKRLGGGAAYYIASRPDAAFLNDFYGNIAPEAGLKTMRLPAGVQIIKRGQYLFAMNFSGAPARVELPRGADALTGAPAGGTTTLAAAAMRVIRCAE